VSRTGPFRSFLPRQIRAQADATRVMRRRAKHIVSREHFEALIAKSDKPEAMRALLEPLLPASIPCCLRFKIQGEHTRLCPLAVAVEVHP